MSYGGIAMSMRERIGKNIQKLRKDKGLTQRELAKMIGVATGTLQQYELGKRQPKIEMMTKICQALDVPLHNSFSPFLTLFMGDISEVTVNDPVFNSNENTRHIHLTTSHDPLTGMPVFRNETMIEYSAYLKMLRDYDMLNTIGKTEAQKRISELTEIKRYTEPDTPPQTTPTQPDTPTDVFSDAPAPDPDHKEE